MADKLLGDGAGSNGTAVFVAKVANDGGDDGGGVNAGVRPKGIVFGGNGGITHHVRDFVIGEPAPLFGGVEFKQKLAVAVKEAGGAACAGAAIGGNLVNGPAQLDAEEEVGGDEEKNGRYASPQHHLQQPAHHPATAARLGRWLLLWLPPPILFQKF